jgi:phosphoribosylformylglycinamidine (FGAM) synthase-like enzyme
VEPILQIAEEEGTPASEIGRVTGEDLFLIRYGDKALITQPLEIISRAWQEPIEKAMEVSS